jgi:hypothetical protein
MGSASDNFFELDVSHLEDEPPGLRAVELQAGTKPSTRHSAASGLSGDDFICIYPETNISQIVFGGRQYDTNVNTLWWFDTGRPKLSRHANSSENISMDRDIDSTSARRTIWPQSQHHRISNICLRWSTEGPLPTWSKSIPR